MLSSRNRLEKEQVRDKSNENACRENHIILLSHQKIQEAAFYQEHGRQNSQL